MNLQDFVKESIVQIVRGVQDAGEELVGVAHVNPLVYRAMDPSIYAYYYPGNKGEKLTVQPVEFDVAVQAAEGEQASGGIGVAVAWVGLGAKKQTEASSSTVSRVKFTVPVVFPAPPA